MKIFLKSILMTFLLVAGFSTLQAQKPLQKQEKRVKMQGDHQKRGFDPVKKAEHKTAKMKEQLSLSDQQTAQVKDINLKYAQKMKAAHGANANNVDKAKKHEAMKGLRTEQMNELKKVLTTEQWQKWEQLKQERKAKHGGKGKGKGKVRPEKAY